MLFFLTITELYNVMDR